ncbi:MAG TPA: hypothetical protein PLO62_07585 [Candidatus Hydrogenedentes bacterium]|nr:hypothetical protein [Candidatus Hydrogenedentota bacterium]
MPSLMRNVALAATLGACCAATWAWGDFSAARIKAEEFFAERKAVADAMAAGDESAYRSHASAAEKASKDALLLFEQEGIGTAKDGAILSLYARVLHQTGDYDLEAKAWERVVSVKPDDGESWLALARAYEALGPRHGDKVRGALKHAEKASGSASAQASVWEMKGRLLQREGLYELARRDYEKAVQLDADALLPQLGLVSLDIREGRMAEAWDRFEKIASSPEIAEEAGPALERALFDFDHSRRWIADTPADHAAYGKFLLQAGRAAEALAPIKRVAMLAPDDYLNWNLLGSVAQRLGDKDLARQAFEKSLALRPDQPRTEEALHGIDASGDKPVRSR